MNECYKDERLLMKRNRRKQSPLLVASKRLWLLSLSLFLSLRSLVGRSRKSSSFVLAVTAGWLGERGEAGSVTNKGLVAYP